MNTQIDHAEYPKRLRALPIEALQYIIRDASEAARLNPTGHKAGYYLDEVNYCSDEISRRAKKG